MKCLEHPPPLPAHTHTHTPTHTHTMCGEWEMSILAWLSLILFQLFMLSASTLLKGKTSLQLHFNFKEIRELGTLTLYFTIGFNFRKVHTFSYVNVVWNWTVVQHWFSFLFISFLLSIPYLHQRKLDDVPWSLIASYLDKKWKWFERISNDR